MYTRQEQVRHAITAWPCSLLGPTGVCTCARGVREAGQDHSLDRASWGAIGGVQPEEHGRHPRQV